MNVKQGDLAIVIRDSMYCQTAGRIVDVLYLAPQCEFKFPDGYLSEGANGLTSQWVVRFHGTPLPLPILKGGGVDSHRLGNYAVVIDAVLRPVSGLPDDTTTDTEQPIKEVA